MSALSPKAEARDIELAPTQGRSSCSSVLQALKLYRLQEHTETTLFWVVSFLFYLPPAPCHFVGRPALQWSEAKQMPLGYRPPRNIRESFDSWRRGEGTPPYNIQRTFLFS